MSALAAYLALVVAGFLPSEVWRWLAVLLARSLDENSEIVVWVRAVATAILAGVIAKLTLFPPGALAGVPLAVRLGSIVVAFVAFLAARRSVLVGILAGEIALIGASFLAGR